MERPADLNENGLLSRKDVLVLAGVLVFLLLLFGRVLVQPGDVCLGRRAGDARNQFYGWRAYGFGQVRAGRFPLWNPYEFLGMPFVAGLQSAMFYPTNWLCAVMPLGRAINLGIVVNLFLSALFTYLWARRMGLRPAAGLVAAAAYTFGAPQFLRILEGHWSFLCPMPWIPCVLLCVEVLVSGRARWLAVAGGAVAVALQLFGGNPQYAFYGGIATLLYFAVRAYQARHAGPRALLKAAACLVCLYVLGAILAGVQLLPALELLSVSSRKGQLSYAWISQYSLTPESLITLLIPDFFGSDATLQYWGRWNLWEASMYVGVAVFGLVLLGFFGRKRGLAVAAGGVAAVLLVLALGNHTPILWVLYHVVPGFDLFRVPARFLCPFSLFAGLLAGLGVETLLEAGESEGKSAAPLKEKAYLRGAIWTMGGVALALGLTGAALAAQWEFARGTWTRFMEAMLAVGSDQRLYLPWRKPTEAFALDAMREAGVSLVRSAVLLGILAGLGALALRARGRTRWLAAVLVLLVACDAWGFSRRYLVTFDPREDSLTEGALRFLGSADRPFRYARGGDLAFPQCEGMTHELCCIEGIQPNVPRRFRDVFWTFQGRKKTEQRTVYSIYRIMPPFRMLNLRYLVQRMSNPATDMPGLRPGVYRDDRIRIDELPNPWPRAWLVHDYVVIPDSDNALATLRLINYEAFAVFEEEPGCRVTVPAQKEPLPKITAYEPDRVVVEVDAASAAFLILSDLHFPGWKATLDGRAVPILRANYLMRAVHVPEGKHTVEFCYRPASFKAGVVSSCLGLIGVAALVVFHVRSNRRSSPGSRHG